LLATLCASSKRNASPPNVDASSLSPPIYKGPLLDHMCFLLSTDSTLLLTRTKSETEEPMFVEFLCTLKTAIYNNMTFTLYSKATTTTAMCAPPPSPPTYKNPSHPSIQCVLLRTLKALCQDKTEEEEAIL
jgi:hypothetical protein